MENKQPERRVAERRQALDYQHTHPTPATMAAFIDGRLRLLERAAVIEHAANCADCQSEGYGHRVIVARRLTAAEVNQYKALVKSVVAAEADLQAFVNEVKIDPDKATEVGTDGK